MNSPLRVGITGGIGSGKSTIAAVFELLDVPVYNADQRARNLMNQNPALVSAIEKRFGSAAYENGKLNSKYLAQKVFSNEKEVADLNTIVHPAVAYDFSKWAEQQTAPYVLKEAALLFETGSYKELDKVILVTAPKELRISRVLSRDPQRSASQVNQIMQQQMDPEAATSLATYIINNGGDSLLIPKILDIDLEIKKAISQTFLGDGLE